MTEIAARFPATGADIAVSITRAVTIHRIGMRLAFEPGSLDGERLARAVRLSLDAEPTLGCAWTTGRRRASWSRLADLDDSVPFSVSGSSDPDADMTAFQTAEVPDGGPQASVALFRAPDADHLGIKVSHVLADGQAAKQYAYDLARIYSRLAEDASYRPEPNLAGRPSGRDVWAQLSAEQRRDAKRAKSWVDPTWVVPSKGTSWDGFTYRTAFVEPELFRRVKEHGKQRGSTVNDMMLAAVFRTCVALFDPPTGKPLSLMCTADLRRFLADPEHLPISNVSISGSLDIERMDGEAFDGTLARVRESMARWARECYGAGPFANAERLASLGYGLTKAVLGLAFRSGGSSGRTYPWYTNIGIIDADRLSFAGVTPLSGHMYGPGNAGAAIVPVVSTLRDRLAISMGYCDQDMDPDLIERFLGRVRRELEDATA